MKTKLIACFLATTLLTACAQPSQNRYGFQNVGHASVVTFGTVIAEREVEITGQNTGIGATTGALGGALAGSYVGNGGGSLAGMLAGALIAGVAGAAAEQALADRKGIEYIVTEENGQTVTIVQNIAKDDQPLKAGERVQIQTSGNYQRVMPAESLPEEVKRPKGIEVKS